MRILLIEDHPALAEAVTDALRRAGFAVDHASSATKARWQHPGLCRAELGLRSDSRKLFSDPDFGPPISVGPGDEMARLVAHWADNPHNTPPLDA
jgi:hypothetical protein